MSRLLTRLLCGLTITLGVATAHAVPTLAAASPRYGFSFSEYVGDASLGHGLMGLNDQVFWVHEGTSEYNGSWVDSWFLIFEPTADRVKGRLHFDGLIEAVFDSPTELRASADFESETYDYDYRRWVGLEKKDKIAVRGSSLLIDWRAGPSGDHVRVLTRAAQVPAQIEAPAAPIPEPSTYALMGAGLLAVIYLSRRRQDD